MKKLISAVLAGSMAMSLAACGGSAASSQAPPPPALPLLPLLPLPAVLMHWSP